MRPLTTFSTGVSRSFSSSSRDAGMKLRKNAPAKAIVVTAVVGLFFAIYGAVRADPRITTEPKPDVPAIDYDRFFSPGRPAQSPGDREATSPRTPAPDARTRAS